MSGMFDLRDIFQFTIDCLNNRVFPQENLIHHEHQFFFHIFLYLGDELQTSAKQFIE